MAQRLKFTNFYVHESDERYIVYEFGIEERADYFESLLKDREVIYERHLETESDQPIILFGIHKRYRQESDRCNYLTNAKFRGPLIPNLFARYALLIVTFGLILLAIIGYFVSR